jgi:capsular polysaccharide biosynthesis protein
MSEKKTGVEEGIDLMEVIKQIWAGRKTVLLFMAAGFLLAVVVVLVTPKQYQTQVKLLAETGSKNGAGGLLGQLGGMSGLNLGGLSGLMGGSSSEDALTPELYPDVVKSTPFLLEVLGKKVTESKHGVTMTVADYLSLYSKSPFSGLTGIFKGKPEAVAFPKAVGSDPSKGLLNLTKDQKDLVDGLADIISLSVASSAGGGLTGGGSKVITVSTEVQDPQVSAQLADSVVGCLKNYIISYNTEKANRDLDFVKARFNEARDKYYATQQALASHNDRNLNVITSSANMSKERLTTENVLASNIYNSMAQVMEQAKLKVQDQTPVFTVIEPAKVPLFKSKPKGVVIAMGLMFVGAFIGVGVVFLRKVKG